eukprot:g63474.t1
MTKPLVERVDSIRVDSNGQGYVTINGDDYTKSANVRKLEEVDLPESLRQTYHEWPLSFTDLAPNITTSTIQFRRRDCQRLKNGKIVLLLSTLLSAMTVEQGGQGNHVHHLLQERHHPPDQKQLVRTTKGGVDFQKFPYRGFF